MLPAAVPRRSFRRKFDDVSDLEFTGAVPDMRVEIAKATVCVVPLRIGSGTRLKILEAAAMGKAIVSTRLGAEGLSFVNTKEIVLADDPEVFATETARLLTDRRRREEIGGAARVRVEEDYSLTVLRLRLREALKEICR